MTDHDTTAHICKALDNLHRPFKLVETWKGWEVITSTPVTKDGKDLGVLALCISLDPTGGNVDIELDEGDVAMFEDDVDVPALSDAIAERYIDTFNYFIDTPTGEGLLQHLMNVAKDDEGLVKSLPHLDGIHRIEREFEDTASALQAMLTENTGRVLVDSGDHYGRQWQRNQGVDFEASPEGRLEVWSETDWYPVVSIYHFLKATLSYEPDLDARFQAFMSEEVRDGKHLRDRSYAEEISDFIWAYFVEEKLGRPGDEPAYRGEGLCVGPYGEDPATQDNVTWGDYTYNHENSVSQDFIWNTFHFDGEMYVVIQIHGGCDARWGFTKPRIFTASEGLSFLDYNRASLYCTNKDCSCSGHYESGDVTWHDWRTYKDFEAEVRSSESDEVLEPDDRVAIINKDERTMTCPLCHVGKIEVGPWP